MKWQNSTFNEEQREKEVKENCVRQMVKVSNGQKFSIIYKGVE